MSSHSNSAASDWFLEVMMPVRRRISIDDHVWHALQQLCLDTGKDMQVLADEPVTLTDALRESLRMQPANEQPKATVHRLRKRR
jgi:hypothetical protein